MLSVSETSQEFEKQNIKVTTIQNEPLSCGEMCELVCGSPEKFAKP